MVEQHLQLTFEFDNTFIQQKVVVLDAEIREIFGNAIWEVGKKFSQIRDELRHNKKGGFREWLDYAGWSKTEVYRDISVYETFSTVPNLGQLEIGKSAYYLLAAPSTPEFAREEALNRAENGETITYTTAKEIVDWHKEQSRQTEPTIQSFDTWANDPNPPYEVEEDLPDSTPFRQQPLIVQDQPMTILSSSQNDSWRTPLKYIEAARQVLGTIDLDPASSTIANETIQAKYILTKEDNGLNHTWFGNVWINPPYGKTNNLSNQGLFAHKLIQEYMDGHVTAGIILVNLYFGYGWFAPLRTYPMCLVDHRISFIDPSTDEEGDEAKASSVFIYVGKNHDKFREVFRQFGPFAWPSYE